MIGTLLEDIAAGLSFEVAARRFAEKMHPLQYQRPQAAPSAGNIAAAEKLVEQFGIARSLERRFARLDELETVWGPVAESAPAPGGVFGHIKPKESAPRASMVAPAQPITWVKFAATVLPEARRIELNVPTHGAFSALLTAVHPDAPPILQWDLPERRNPVSWYQYVGGSSARSWGLQPGTWAKVNAITLRPAMWYGANFEHQGKSALLIVDGAKDSRTDQGNGLFPETLKAELRAVRSTIESFSKVATIHGAAEASACGLIVPAAVLRVTNQHGVVTAYHVDRWD
jgi:hypothetical protein